MEEEVGHGRVWAQVAVLLDGRDVVEHKATAEGVAVDKESHGEHQGAVHPSAHRPACRGDKIQGYSGTETRLGGEENLTSGYCK